MRVTFFCFAKRKSPKKRRPPVCDPFASLWGKPASGRLRGAPQNSLRACGAPLGQLRRVRARSTGASTPMPPHNRPTAGAASRGGSPTSNSRTSKQPHGPLLRSAVLAQRAALAPARWGRAQRRPEWMSGCCGFPSGCAWGAQGAGWHVCRRTHVLRELTYRSCPSGAPMARSEFCGALRDRAPQVAPQRSEGVADSRVAFSLVTFSWRPKRKLLRRRAHTPASALCKDTQATIETIASNALWMDGRRQNASKNSAAKIVT